MVCLIILFTSIFAAQEGIAFMHTNTNTEDEMGIVEPYHMASFDQKIDNYYQSNAAQHQLTKRLESAATFFLDQPYAWEPLGEGAGGKYYQEPLYRTDRFDCVTFVDTVLALSKSTDLNQFKQSILQLRYTDQEINYTHNTEWFTDLEWLPNVRKRGWLEDITDQVINKNDKPIAKMASTIIDKPNWYKVRPMKALRLEKPLAKEEAQRLLLELQAEGHAFKAVPSTLSYLPLTELFDSAGKPNTFLFDQIPSGSVVVIVRPDWQIRDHLEGYPNGYGTNLNVSHLGIAIRTREGLMFFHASSVDKKVVRLPLTEYLKHYINSPTIKGIHVEKIL